MIIGYMHHKLIGCPTGEQKMTCSTLCGLNYISYKYYGMFGSKEERGWKWILMVGGEREKDIFNREKWLIYILCSYKYFYYFLDKVN